MFKKATKKSVKVNPTLILTFFKYGRPSSVNQLDVNIQNGVNANAHPLPFLIYEDITNKPHIQASAKNAFEINSNDTFKSIIYIFISLTVLLTGQVPPPSRYSFLGYGF